MTGDIYQYFDDLDNTWTNLYKLVFSHDVNGNMDNMFYYDYYNYWELINKDAMTYDKSISASELLPISFYEHTITPKDIYFQTKKPPYSVEYYYNNYNNWVLTGDSAVYFYSKLPTSISSHEENPDISIWPNPTTDNFKLCFEQRPTEDYDLYIYSVLGKLVKKQQLYAFKNEYSIDIRDLKSGVYFVRLEYNGKRFFSSKTIKQ